MANTGDRRGHRARLHSEKQRRRGGDQGEGRHARVGRVYTQKSRGGEEETKGKGDTRTCWMRAVKATMWPSVPAPCHLARVLRGALRAKS